MDRFKFRLLHAEWINEWMDACNFHPPIKAMLTCYTHRDSSTALKFCQCEGTHWLCTEFERHTWLRSDCISPCNRLYALLHGLSWMCKPCSRNFAERFLSCEIRLRHRERSRHKINDVMTFVYVIVSFPRWSWSYLTGHEVGTDRLWPISLTCFCITYI